MNLKRTILIGLAVLTLGGVAAGCGTGSGASAPSAADQAQKASKSLQSQIYQSTHNVEFRNYNLRQKVADDPSTILWCTFFPPGVSQVSNGGVGGAITVPIAGKLTSSNKRPYNNVVYDDRGNYTFTSKEIAGPDHMFGSSSEYRYGFDPTLGTYYDFTDMASFCTTEPTLFQTHDTTIVVKTDATINSISNAASQAIKDGNGQKALDLLKQAETTQASGK